MEHTDICLLINIDALFLTRTQHLVLCSVDESVFTIKYCQSAKPIACNVCTIPVVAFPFFFICFFVYDQCLLNINKTPAVNLSLMTSVYCVNHKQEEASRDNVNIMSSCVPPVSTQCQTEVRLEPFFLRHTCSIYNCHSVQHFD